jgi:thiol:disulfide interchange protein DsbD
MQDVSWRAMRRASGAAAAMLAGLSALAAAGAASALEGPVVATENVEARLVAEVNAAAPGETIVIGLHKIIRPHWHTYWINPGDAGEPTRITFENGEALNPSEFFWPLPSAIPVEDILVNYGYSDEVLLPLEITVPADATPGETLTLPAYATWLVCEDICIPEEANLTLDIPIAEESVHDPRWGDTLAEQVAATPRPMGFDAGIERADDKVLLTVADPILEAAIAEDAIRDIWFFPFDGTVIRHAEPQLARFGPNGIELEMTPNFGLADELIPIDGVLAFEEMRGEGWARHGVEISAAVGRVDVGAVVAAAGGSGAAGFGGGFGGPVGFLQMALFAFIGGLILNLMPCVFPVLSIKAISVMEHAHGDAADARKNGAAFLGGVLATFTLLAAALIVFKAAGAQVGWGFQLQSPWFVTAVAVLFFLIGLNLLGVFEVGGRLQNVGSGAASMSGPAGSFFVGALAVVAASPCTAPFMSVALPAALAAPAPAALAIFLALGLGFGAPFALLSFFPAWGRFLPKPGAWMDRLKQFFAFPMFGAAIWLVWVLASQAGPNGVLAALGLMTGVGFLIWAFNATAGSGGARKAVARGSAAAVLVLLFAGSYSMGAFNTAGPDAAAPGAAVASDHEPWSAERVAEIRAEGRPVFVDFTAAWCITCQANKLTTLNRESVQAMFEQTNTVQLVADWTNRDADIANELAKYGRSGVPLYLMFPPEGEAIVLNELLTEQHVIDAIERAASRS